MQTDPRVKDLISEVLQGEPAPSSVVLKIKNIKLTDFNPILAQPSSIASIYYLPCISVTRRRFVPFLLVSPDPFWSITCVMKFSFLGPIFEARFIKSTRK